MSHRVVWTLAVVVAVGVLGWLVVSKSRTRFRTALLGQERYPLVGGLVAGLALLLPAALLLHGLPVSVNVPATGGLLAVAAAGFAVFDRGYVPSLIAVGIPIALLRFATRGCGDSPPGAAVMCRPIPVPVATLEAIGGALAVSAIGYLVGRSALVLRRSVATDPAAS